MGRKSIETLNKEWLTLVNSLGLLNQKLFRQAFESYEFQISLAEKLRKRIEEEGTSIIVPVGKDGEKQASNPAIADLNKAEILAQKIRLELDAKVKEAIQDQKEELKRKAEEANNQL